MKRIAYYESYDMFANVKQLYGLMRHTLVWDRFYCDTRNMSMGEMSVN